MIISFFIYLIKVSFCTALFYAFYHLVLKKENFFQLNRVYIIGSVILSLFIPYWQVTLSTTPESTVDIYLSIDEYVVSEVSSAIGIQEASPLGFDKILLTIYGMGVLFLLIKLMTSLFYILHLRMWNRIEKKNDYHLVHINQSHPVFSFLNMIFWSDHLDYSDEEANQILLHELVHIKQRHSLDVLFFEMINILLWFNPFIYLYKQSLKNTHEFIADYHLYEEQRFEIRYVDLLMKEAKTQHVNTLPVVHTFFNNQLKKRLIMIRNTNRRSSKFKLLACLPLVAMLIFMISCNKEIVTKASNNQKKEPISFAIPGNMVITCGIDELGMITAEDGKKVTVNEMKAIIVEKQKAKGQNITVDQIKILTKEEMARHTNASENDKLPELGESKVWVTDDNKVNIKEQLGPNQYGPNLPVKKFEVALSVPAGEMDGQMTYKTRGLSLGGDQIVPEVIELFQSVPISDIENSRLVLKNVIFTKDGKDYIKKENVELSLYTWQED